MVVHELHAIELSRRIRAADIARDHARVLEVRLRRIALEVHHQVVMVAEVLGRFAAAGDDLRLGARALPAPHDLLGGAGCAHVEAAGQTAVGRDHDHQAPLHLIAPFEHGVVTRDLGILRNGEHHVGKRGLVGLGLHRAIERATDLGRRDHLHRARDLLGALHRRDALPDVAKVCHEVTTPLPRRPQRARRRRASRSTAP